MGMRIPPLEIKILPESNPLKSRILVQRLAVPRAGGRSRGGRNQGAFSGRFVSWSRFIGADTASILPRPLQLRPPLRTAHEGKTCPAPGLRAVRAGVEFARGGPALASKRWGTENGGLIRGSHFSNTACLTHVFLQQLNKVANKDDP